MTCNSCKKECTQLISAWSAGWIASNLPPISICADCTRKQTQAVFGQEAWKKFNNVKQFVTWTQPDFEQLQSDILLNGDILKGREGYAAQSGSLTLLSRLLVSYKEDYWIVTKYSIINLGQDTFWFDRLEFR